MASFNYWERYANTGRMPDLRTKIIHSTRASMLSWFGRGWRSRNHAHVSGQRRAAGVWTPSRRGGSANHHFSTLKTVDVAPVEKMDGTRIPYSDRKRKQQPIHFNSVYSNFSGLSSKKKLHLGSATPKRMVNTDQFESYKSLYSKPYYEKPKGR